MNNKNYSVFYISNDKRIESMLICSLNNRIDWCEQGLKVVTWSFKKIESGKSPSLKQVFKKYSALRFDKRRKQQYRAINIGDVIVFDDVPWMISAFGFMEIPQFLWNKIIKK